MKRKTGSKPTSKKKNKKSKERYLLRKLNKKLKKYELCVEDRNVYNLSSIELPIIDLYALEYGHGFVVTPNNKMKEEEFVILESFRFLDRLGKADQRLSRSEAEASDCGNESPVCQNTIQHCDVEIGNVFKKNDSVPSDLRIYQPVERELVCSETKIIKKEFEELNTNVRSSLKTMKCKFNVPKVIRNSILKLKKLVNEKVIDIRKVDKGQTILIIDYDQRISAEKENITKIATVCPVQKSNWEENKLFVENCMKKLYRETFISRDELAAVTGLLAGGSNGKLKNKDGSIKFSHILSQKELFAQQRTPYVYPLFKAHKLPLKDLLQSKPEEVHKVVPSRLVVGMANCQMSRVQRFLETILSPISKLYGSFEYIKDSTDFLIKLETMKSWDWKKIILFTVDVKALYPSVRINDVEKSLQHCFNKCTDWEDSTKQCLIDLIIYTLKNQQTYWQGQYYMLCKGITNNGWQTLGPFSKHIAKLHNYFCFRKRQSICPILWFLY